MLFNLFKKKTKNQDHSSALQSLHGRELNYITKRNPSDYGETILGRNAVINIVDNELVILSGNEVLLRYPVEDVEAYELMSLDGVNLRCKDKTTGACENIVAYYKYYRK